MKGMIQYLDCTTQEEGIILCQHSDNSENGKLCCSLPKKPQQFTLIHSHNFIWNFSILMDIKHSGSLVSVSDMLFNPHYFNYSAFYINFSQRTINSCRKFLLMVRYLFFLLYHNISQSLCLHWFLIFIQNHDCKKKNIGRKV